MKAEKEQMKIRLEEMSAASKDASMHLEEDWVSLTNRLKVSLILGSNLRSQS